MFTFVYIVYLISFQVMARTKLTKSYQIKQSKHIGWPGSGLEYILQSHFTKFAQIKIVFAQINL